jgi:glutamate synthase (NADPH/NADH) small chain
MSGYHHEWECAKQEGVRLLENALVAGVTRGSDGTVTALELVRAQNGRPTEEALDPLPTDLVVVAIGQAKLRGIAGLFSGVEVDDSGCLVADRETGVTGNPRIFAGGDAVNGGKEVVNAAAEGQAAAHAIDRQLTEQKNHA